MGGSVMRPSLASRAMRANRLSLAFSPIRLRYWLARKKAAPIRAAITWATVRVRRGPIRANSAMASSRPTPAAARAAAISTTNTDAQAGWPSTIDGVSSSTAGTRNQRRADTARPKARTNSTLRGDKGEENRRSRSPRT
jgi:hypothetical protein